MIRGGAGAALAVAGILAVTPSVALADDADADTAELTALENFPPLAPLPIEPTLRRRSFLWPILESATIIVGFNLGARLLDKPYAEITFGTIEDNLTGDWVWDDDAFSTNQLGHPYMGSLFYAAARSNGFGVIGSGVVTYVDSLVYEYLMETDKPSLNDQLITPGAGALLGEVLHRWSRSLLWRPGGAAPAWWRYALAGLIDPVGSINDAALGRAWSRVPPPPSFGWIGLGWSGLGVALDREAGEPDSDTNLVYGVIGYSYGLPTDARYRPRTILDHFDLRIEAAVNRDVQHGALHLRGLIYGWTFGGPRLRGIWGAWGTYDFDSADRLSVSTLGLGVGTTLHAPFGSRGFFQATAVASVIPYGSAGGDLRTGTLRDYHRGPGASELIEAKVGHLGTGLARLSVAGYQIDGAPFGEGSELIVQLRLGALVAITGPHALGVDAGFTVRRGSFVDPSAEDVLDRLATFRVFYALISDRDFGGGASLQDRE